MKLGTLLRGAALWGALLAAGCSGGSSNSTDAGSTTGGGDAGADAGTGEVDITVTGTAKVHPELAKLYGNGTLTGSAPAVQGLSLRVDEPLRVILGLDHARLGETTLPADGTYSIGNINVDNVTVGLVATIGSSSPDGGLLECAGATPPAFCSSFETSATGISDGKPSADITGTEAFGVPVAFESFLSGKLGLTGAGQSLDEQGWVLGYVVDGSGNPVAGVTLDTSLNSTKPDVRYLDDAFNPVAAGAPQVTNSAGLFVVVNPGNPTTYPKAFGIEHHPELGCHKLGSNAGSVFNLVYDARKPGRCN